MFRGACTAAIIAVLISASIGVSVVDAQQVVTDGLIGYWNMEKIVGGNTVEETIAGHDGTIVDGNLIPADGKIGKALEFDGSGVHIQVDNSDDFDTNADFTWCAWIKTANPGGGIVANTPPEPGSDAQGAKTLFLDAGVLTFDTGWVDGAGGAILVNDDQWHYVAVTVTFDGDDTLQFYVDGQADTAGQMNVDEFPEEGFLLHIGVDPRVPGEGISVPFAGIIDEVAIYNRALTAEEIAQNANSDVGLLLPVEPAGKLAVTWGGLKE